MISDDHSLGGSYRDTILRGYQLLERNKREKGSLRETNGEKKNEVVEKKKKRSIWKNYWKRVFTEETEEEDYSLW